MVTEIFKDIRLASFGKEADISWSTYENVVIFFSTNVIDIVYLYFKLGNWNADQRLTSGTVHFASEIFTYMDLENVLF